MAERLDLKNLKGTWMIIKDKVYDVSKFSDHPGGFEVLADCKGKDSTTDYIDANHPDYVEEDMKKYYIGDVPKIHQDEVAKHKTENDAWLAIHGKVYDISKFTDHPGGAEILLENSGKNATVAFDTIDHSKEAKKDLYKYYIGEYIPDPNSESLPSTNYFIYIPLLALIIGIILNSFYFN
ncbi:hypothetical protein SteCoe_31073 [Stentor coeruleus]|uniref:Cytochrome b5 heme-binding domain-containing protein n=1 Tax=Stentor coeruleus TaxID=5963 RepID=A0A1R2B254_9CILI|nr:hypothetical protein SteCoe_31073 [Stentor coeruleus]